MSLLATVDPQRRTLLSSEEAVDLFRDLLWVESARQGINMLDVNSAPTESGLLSEGLTKYQIKTGAFSASNESEFKELFFKKNKAEFKEQAEDQNCRMEATMPPLSLRLLL